MASSRSHGVQVPATSTKKIADLTDAIRVALDLNSPFFPIVKVYEVLHYFVEGARFEVREICEMGDDHGRTYPDRGVILIREDVYQGAYLNKPRDRFTLCHELGHLLMHRGISLSRVDPNNPPKIYMNSEWQADIFASHLLMPNSLLKNYSDVGQVVSDFVVSYDAAYSRSKDFMVSVK